MANKVQGVKKKLPTSAVIAISIVVSVMVVALSFTAERTLITQLQRNAKVIDKKQDAEKTLSQNIDNLPQLASAYNALGDTRRVIDEALPKANDFPALVATMEVIAGNSSVVLNEVSRTAASTIGGSSAAASTTPTNPSDAVDTINGATSTDTSVASTPTSPLPFTFSVKIDGTYANVISFLGKLQLSSRPIKITSMKLTGTTNDLSAEISMTTYYYDPNPLADKTEEVK